MSVTIKSVPQQNPRDHFSVLENFQRTFGHNPLS
jgi:hypothetical protein